MDISQTARRSPLYRTLLKSGAHFSEWGDTAIVMDYGNPTAETESVRHLGITDLTPLPRTGYKGAGAPDWLRAQGLTLPNEPNRAVRQNDGTLVAALSWQEHLLLPPLVGDSAIVSTLDGAWTLDSAPRCYRLPRRDSHCWLTLSGAQTSAMLAKLCGVDLRLHQFADGAIAQTSLARINAIVIRHDFGKTPGFYLLADSASAEYLWTCLVDAMAEFGGTPVGLATLRMLSEVQ